MLSLLLILPIIGIIGLRLLSKSTATLREMSREPALSTGRSTGTKPIGLSSGRHPWRGGGKTLYTFPYSQEEISLSSTASTKKLVLLWGLTISALMFLVTIEMWLSFNTNTTLLQYTLTIGYNNLGTYVLGVDRISLFFILLTTFIIPVCMLADFNYIDSSVVRLRPDRAGPAASCRKPQASPTSSTSSRTGGYGSLAAYFSMLLIIETLLIIVFTASDIFLFYVAFESILPPLLIMILIWGNAHSLKKRVRASLLLFLYTLFGSLFMLLSFIAIYQLTGSTSYQTVCLYMISPETQNLLWLPIFFAFAIKTPMVPVHLWLTQAHSEASLSGSILLASVVLKLSIYGMIRYSIILLPDAMTQFAPLAFTISSISIIYSCLSTIRQIDFKKLIAYSSIRHTNLCVLGIISNNIQGIEGRIFLGIAHRIVSPALFISVTFIYKILDTRTISYYRGLVYFFPIFGIFFFIFSLSNIAIPLSANFIGEFLSLLGAFQLNPIMTIISSISIILSAIYALYLFNRVMFGPTSAYLSLPRDPAGTSEGSSKAVLLKDIQVSNLEGFVALLTLLILTIVLGIFPNLILDYLHLSVSTILRV